MLGVWLLVALAFVLLGAFVSSALALFIGISITEDDAVQEAHTDEPFRLLLQRPGRDPAPRREKPAFARPQSLRSQVEAQNWALWRPIRLLTQTYSLAKSQTRLHLTGL